MIPQELIEKAFSLTGNTIGDMVCDYWTGNKEYATLTEWFSFEKFCYYLLSPEFIVEYLKIDSVPDCSHWWVAYDLWEAIYEYQKGNEERLIDLLSVIK